MAGVAGGTACVVDEAVAVTVWGAVVAVGVVACAEGGRVVAKEGAPAGGGRVVVGIVMTELVSRVTSAGDHTTSEGPKDQSITPWSPCKGGRGPSTISTTSPTRLKRKKVSARAALRFTQPCDTLMNPWSLTDHGAAWTYSPLSEIWTSQ